MYKRQNQYLSLLNESDKALENLITYFKGVDDPVEIVFFGDHQPGLCKDVYKRQRLISVRSEVRVFSSPLAEWLWIIK